MGMKLTAWMVVVLVLGGVAFTKFGVTRAAEEVVAPPPSIPPGMVLDMRRLFR